MQVWFSEDGGDTLDDAAYAGRFAISAKYWPSTSRKRSRPRVRSARDVQAEVLFVFRCQPDAAAAAEPVPATAAAVTAVAAAATSGTNIEPLAFRRLFREVVFRAQVEYSSDKMLRAQRVSGVVVQERHRLSFSTPEELSPPSPSSSTLVEDVMDTRTADIPRKKRSKKKKASGTLPSSSSKVLARSTPLDLSGGTPDMATTGVAGSGSSHGATTNALVIPALEQEHVHKVYDSIADHWDGTRYAPWPRVVEFIQSLPPSSLVAGVYIPRYARRFLPNLVRSSDHAANTRSQVYIYQLPPPGC